MKKVKVLMSVFLIAVFMLFAIGSGDSSTDDQGKGETVEKSEESNVGDYKVVIDSCRLAKDYEGKSVVIVKYIFTNVADDDAASFMFAFDDTVYQNGVGLNEAYVLEDSANYSSDNQTKEIKKGASIDVEVAYELNDVTTDVEVEVKELISFNDTTVKKTFSIAQ